MNAMKQALIAAHRECPDFPVDRPKPSTAFWCMKARSIIEAMDGHKRCGHCHAVKPLDAFHRDAHGSNGRQSGCKECRAAYNQKRRAA